MLLLKYWQPIASAIATAVLAFFIGNLVLSANNTSHELKMAQAVLTAETQCRSAQQITTEISHDYQTKLAGLNARLNKLRQRQTCVPITSPATGHDAAKGGEGLFTGDAVTSNALYDFAYNAERVGTQLDACQEFIRKAWER